MRIPDALRRKLLIYTNRTMIHRQPDMVVARYIIGPIALLQNFGIERKIAADCAALLS